MPLPGMQSKDLPTELTLWQASDILHLTFKEEKPVYKVTITKRIFSFLFFQFFFVFFSLFLNLFLFPFFLIFFLLFSKFFFHLFCSVGPHELVPLGGDRCQLQLGAQGILLDSDGAVIVGPKLEDVARPLELADLVEETISTPCEHEVKV